jgi:L-seryl-tRNA(Ser) seleniumtransferase
MPNELLRAIPSVNDLLELPEVRELAARTSREYARDRLREALERMRFEIASGRLAVPAENLPREAVARVLETERVRTASLRRVVNASGVVLHTNLGRAPLSERALRAVTEIAGGYSNLEYDVAAGGRGRRDAHGEALLREILGCEAAVVANNNAAAVMLVLNTLAAGGEVIVSRGELVEIGGGFRVPEVLERSGCTLVAVGTTNRTRADDYERAVSERTRLLLRVHPSNYRIVGFTERPTASELSDLARRHGIPLVDDLGSGCLVDTKAIGLGDEPRCQDALAEGVDVITFSGDKLLGGPQAGIAAGRGDLVEKIRRNPLMRALRVDKMVYAALEATLRAYAEGRAFEEIPSLRMLSTPPGEVRRRAEALAERAAVEVPDLIVSVEYGRSVPGAGSGPGIDLPTAVIAIEHPSFSADELEARLRAGDPPVIGRVEHDRVMLDLRTVPPEDEEVLLRALGAILDS